MHALLYWRELFLHKFPCDPSDFVHGVPDGSQRRVYKELDKTFSTDELKKVILQIYKLNYI